MIPIFKPKYNLIRFSDSTYGVLRTFWLKKSFVSLMEPRNNWASDHAFFDNCKGNKENAEAILNQLKCTYEILDNPV